MKLTQEENEQIKRITASSPFKYWDVRRMYEYCNKNAVKVQQYIDYGLEHNEDPIMLTAIRKLG